MSTIPKTEFFDVTSGTNDDKNVDENNDKKVSPNNRYNSYLFFRIIDSFPRILKWKIIKLIKTSFVSPRIRRHGHTKLTFYFNI